jgi:hypothetical protein
MPSSKSSKSRLVAKPYKCPVSFRCRFHFDGKRVNQTLCQVGVEVSDSAVLRLNCVGSFTASIAATNQV